jgi:putative ATP-dependent endonuclease of OLD family
MKLTRFLIINNKSCKLVDFTPQVILPTSIIGKTDSGKSTILRSIHGFFSQKAPQPIIKEDGFASEIASTCLSQEDLNSELQKISLPDFTINSEKFILFVSELTLDPDESAENQELSSTLQWAIEKNPSKIVVAKYFDFAVPTGKYLILSSDQESNPLQLWKQSATTLKTKREELNLTDADIRNDNSTGRFKNFELVRAIYEKLTCSIQWVEYPDFHKDSAFFPSVAYFDWNKLNTEEIGTLVKGVLTSTIEPHKNKLIAQASVANTEANQEINNEITQQAASLLDELPSIESIQAKVEFKVTDQISEITVKKKHSDGPVLLESQGEGFKKQVGFAFVKWGAKKVTESVKNNNIWLFDEPETHLFPADQREFFESLKKLSTSAAQIILATHSTVFVDRSKFNEIKLATLENGYTSLSQATSSEDLFDLLGIKNSDFLFFDKFLVVEGPTERTLIPYFYQLKYGTSMAEDSIQLVCLSGAEKIGAALSFFSDAFANFRSTNKTCYYILDADASQTGTNIFHVGKADIEDSLPNEIWINVVKNRCGLDITTQELDDIRGKIDKTKQNTKLHKALSDWVIQKSSNSMKLPKKTECAEYIKTIVTDSSLIDAKIIEAFEAARN